MDRSTKSLDTFLHFLSPRFMLLPGGYFFLTRSTMLNMGGDQAALEQPAAGAE